jgi:Ca2+-binding EF-hand superfamily protein
MAVQSPQHLLSQLDLLFALWDVDDNGTLDFSEMNDGLRKLGYKPPYPENKDSKMM